MRALINLWLFSAVIFAAVSGWSNDGVAHSAGVTQLYTFGGPPDGIFPAGSPVLDSSGNLYGATGEGGANGKGTVYRLSPDGTETVLYSFCSLPGCADGAGPAGLIIDAAGNLYGAANGGVSNTGCVNPPPDTPQPCGVVFELSYLPTSGTWKEKIIYSFCKKSTAGICADGAVPIRTKLTIDKSGNLYGMTLYGGDTGNNTCQTGCGVVYKLTRHPGKPQWSERVLYSCGEQQTVCGDVQGPLAIDAAGNLYGTTIYGGSSQVRCSQFFSGCGAVFKLAPDGTGTTLYSFCSQPGCPDGAEPRGGLTIDPAGNLYGTTSTGAARYGTLFALAPSGVEATLYTFPNPSTGTPYIKVPQGVLINDAGDLYGSLPRYTPVCTRICGAMGTTSLAYEFTRKGRYRIVGTLPPNPSDLMMDDLGNLYGTSLNGGQGWGTVFKLTP